MLKWLIFSALFLQQTSLDWIQFLFHQQQMDDQRRRALEKQEVEVRKMRCYIVIKKLHHHFHVLDQNGPDVTNPALTKEAQKDTKTWLKECN